MSPLPKLEIQNRLKELLDNGQKIFATSSFQTHSIPLLHILSEVHPKIPIYFVNTGFLFPETLSFRDDVAQLLDLDLHQLESGVPKIQQTNGDGHFLFTSDPDLCCQINKVDPVRRLLPQFDYWISGIRADQTESRSNLELYSPADDGCTRFHPLLDWTADEIEQYRKEYSLPNHPLDSQGFRSVGCQPCTMKGSSRVGRWSGLKKTECGLHLDLAKSNKKSSG